MHICNLRSCLRICRDAHRGVALNPTWIIIIFATLLVLVGHIVSYYTEAKPKSALERELESIRSTKTFLASNTDRYDIPKDVTKGLDQLESKLLEALKNDTS